MIARKGKRKRRRPGEWEREKDGEEAATTRKLQSQFFTRQILLPHSLKRFRSAAPSITQNALKLNTPVM
ncbi:unnamed protein product [Lasius platythorax]|uniref:Uncharacterized protein n=1 Tax=Lasius platythorax TaxID=488582 RepID=A0AAV2P1M4_9HYME